MESSKDSEIGMFSLKLAKYSFIGGALLAGLFLTTSNFEFVFFGLIYIFLVSLINIIVLLILICSLIYDKKARRQNALAILIVLLNIPAVALYFFLTKLLVQKF